MFYETLRQRSYGPVLRKASGLAHIVDACEYLRDTIDTVTPPPPEPETQRVMDELLRECLKRKPLS